ncbi:Uncharacterised protein [Mycobacteroides abscessus subsp. abscessus]|nr:Uncharacterised protein [Mycobacteroides abscessus subsp. abscessus]
MGIRGRACAGRIRGCRSRCRAELPGLARTGELRSFPAVVDARRVEHRCCRRRIDRNTRGFGSSASSDPPRGVGSSQLRRNGLRGAFVPSGPARLSPDAEQWPCPCWSSRGVAADPAGDRRFGRGCGGGCRQQLVSGLPLDRARRSCVDCGSRPHRSLGGSVLRAHTRRPLHRPSRQRSGDHHQSDPDPRRPRHCRVDSLSGTYPGGSGAGGPWLCDHCAAGLRRR